MFLQCSLTNGQLMGKTQLVNIILMILSKHFLTKEMHFKKTELEYVKVIFFNSLERRHPSKILLFTLLNITELPDPSNCHEALK